MARTISFPLNPAKWPACPMCLSTAIYFAQVSMSYVCGGCNYVCKAERLAKGEDIWWQRAAVLAANGLTLSGRGRPVCVTCRSERLRFNEEQEMKQPKGKILICMDCNTDRGTTGPPLLDNALLMADTLRVGHIAEAPRRPTEAYLQLEDMIIPTSRSGPRRRIRTEE